MASIGVGEDNLILTVIDDGSMMSEVVGTDDAKYPLIILCQNIVQSFKIGSGKLIVASGQTIQVE